MGLKSLFKESGKVGARITEMLTRERWNIPKIQVFFFYDLL